ncbi:hypothetical protein ASE37_24100 [Rhizobium sp. Root268]|nr:hypothetical protein ASC86_24335 [Rhizobium sp. Root1212]KRD28624.1 hypothetical protein ASE37_24100 [Rhizobium sp. Root268]
MSSINRQIVIRIRARYFPRIQKKRQRGFWISRCVVKSPSFDGDPRRRLFAVMAQQSSGLIQRLMPQLEIFRKPGYSRPARQI